MNRFAMLIFGGLLSSLTVSHLAAETYTIASLNSSFDTNLNGWNYTNGSMTASRLPRPSNSADSMVQLRGTGGFGQFVMLNPYVEAQLLRINAFRRSAQGGGNGSPCVAALSYYDEDFNELAKYEIDLPARDAVDADGLVFESTGVGIPLNAVTALVFVWNNNADTEIVIDDFELRDAVMDNTSPVLPSLLFNSRLNVYTDNTVTPNRAKMQGLEFWGSDVDYASKPNPLGLAPGNYFQGMFGSPNQPEFAYQFVNMSADYCYSFRYSGISPDQAGQAVVGFEFYDSKWSSISKMDIPIPAGSFTINKVIVPPKNTAHTSFFIWINKTAQSLTTYPDLFAPDTSWLTIQRIGPRNAPSATVSQLVEFDSLPGYRTFVSRTIGVIIYDKEGINLKSLTNNAFYVTSHSDPNKKYRGTVKAKNIERGLVSVVFTVQRVSSDPTNGFTDVFDLKSLVLVGNVVRDNAGNAVPAKTFAPFIRNGFIRGSNPTSNFY